MPHPFPHLATLLFCVLLLAGCETAPGPDLIFHNGIVWTADEERPRAEAVAITGEVLTAVGRNDDVLGLTRENTTVIDLQGAFVVPGFNDTHIHFGSAARFLEFNIMRTGTQEDFVARVEDVTGRLAEGEWILGGFWGAYDDWAEGSAGGGRRAPFTPGMPRIEAITADHPIFIQKYDRSAYAVNRAAMEAVGLDPFNPEAPAVTFERDDEGRPTGIVSGEGVVRLFADVVPRTFSTERRLAQTRHALAVIAQHGVTSVSDMSDDTQLALFQQLKRDDALTVRVDFRYPLDRWHELAEQGIRAQNGGNDWIRLGGLKGHIDGIMGTSSARFFEPYTHDPSNHGRWRRLMVDEDGNLAEGQFLGYLLNADSAGLQLTVHAIGDEANALLLDYMEALNRVNGPRDRRFRLVHAQVIAPEDFARLGPLGIIAEVQPFHLSDDMRWMEERIGTERSRGAYAFRSIRDSGAPLVFGSDWPGTSAAEYPINPMLGLYAAVTRQTITGEPPGGWFPDERISIEDALVAYTRNPAFASYEENLKGTLTPGKVADLAILDRNLLEIAPADLLNTEVLYTIVGGRIVYAR